MYDVGALRRYHSRSRIGTCRRRMHKESAEDEKRRSPDREHFRTWRQRYGNLGKGAEAVIGFKQKPGLVAYVTCGDPDLTTTEQIVLSAIDAGADVVELGVPFSDPVADGPVIQR